VKGIRGCDEIDKFIGIPSYKQKVLNKSYSYFKMALVSKALKEATNGRGWKLNKLVNLNYYTGKPTRPIFAHLEVGRDKKEELLVEGYMFIRDVNNNKLVLNIYPTMCGFNVDTYYKAEDTEVTVKFFEELEKWMEKNNFYKGEKITPRGHFLPIPNLR